MLIVKQIEVTIMGQSYVLACPEGQEASMLAAVAQVDREMNAIRHGGKVKARERIAVLAALNLAIAPSEGPGSPAPGTGGDVDIGNLIERLDRALGADGQLL